MQTREEIAAKVAKELNLCDSDCKDCKPPKIWDALISARVEAEIREKRIEELESRLRAADAYFIEAALAKVNAKQRVKEMSEALRWIPVEERLPEDGTSALIFVPDWEDAYLRYRVAWIDYDEAPPQWVYYGNRVENVTHWKPLPAAPGARAVLSEERR